MSLVGLPLLPGLLFLLLRKSPMAPPPPVMFRGDPAHTGAAAGTLFDGQGGVRWRVRTDGAVRSSPAVTATRVYVGSGDGNLYSLTAEGTWRLEPQL